MKDGGNRQEQAKVLGKVMRVPTGEGRAMSVEGRGWQEGQGTGSECPAKESELNLADHWESPLSFEPGCDMNGTLA